MKKISFLAGLLFSTASFATVPNIVIDGTIPGQVTLNPTAVAAHAGGQSAGPTRKDIVLLHVSLSAEARANLAAAVRKQQAQTANQAHQSLAAAASSGRQLGMNGVPVLDQGRHGSCVTFATTGAIDAAYSKGDFISQLCNLELGSYLNQQNASYPSGWDGSWNQTVLGQIAKYGVISMTSQVFKGCAGVHFYPGGDEDDRGNPMSTSDFTPRGVNVLAHIATQPILDVNNALTPQFDADAFLTNTKAALQAGHRVIIATLIDEYRGENGAQGRYKSFDDSWILTPEIARDAQYGNIHAGHAVVITGYDDNATISGPDGKHQGVFTIRNSWGSGAGNWGDYYMSYDYFKVLVMEAIAVQPK
jgi:hypothetical protein